MKRFQFSLERLLRVREHQTTLAKQNLAAAIAEAEKTGKALQQAESRLLAYETEWAARSRSRLPVSEWNTYNLLHQSLVEGKQDAAAAHEQSLSVIATRRLELAEARRREKVIETLKEHQWAAYQEEAQKEEQKETDEIAQNVTRVGKEAAQL